jgi:hypothetical protein
MLVIIPCLRLASCRADDRLLGHLLQLGKFGRILYWKNGIHQKDQMGFGGLARPILVNAVKCKY